MTLHRDLYASALELLTRLELDDVMAGIGKIFAEHLQAGAQGLIVWDSDMEEFGRKAAYGADEKTRKLIERVLSDLEDGELDYILPEGGHVRQLTEDEAPGDGSFYLVRLQEGEDFAGCLVLAGDLEIAAIEGLLHELPVTRALHNAWMHAELNAENVRLRKSYDDLEGKVGALEDQTMTLIRDITVNDSIRTKHVEKERLVYWISNAVRSSVRIQEVLDTTVDKIGTTLALSRCHVLRADLNDKIEIYEYHADGVGSVRDDFLEEEGLTFTRKALSLKSPQHLEDPGTADSNGWNKDFLVHLGLRSGLIVPIILRERVMGVVFLEDCEVPREWSIDDIALIGSLADQLAVAIENGELHRELEKQAVTDGLTGVANRRSFNESLSKEFERARRYEQDLSLLVVDLDYLKRINDNYGHMVGDEAIKEIGRVLAQSSRSTDTTARYGGEEFCVLLPNTGIEMAEQLGERLRRLIAEVTIEGPGSLSASIGVANFPLHADSPDLLFLRADEALYRAKQDGRNLIRVSCLGPDGKELPKDKKGDRKQSLVPESSP
ncbi:MAG: sensor domain-containing diguanylate cyclase [Cyanobacteria bacterium HKST-UBA02]|nr:sensor domain-containing diguanylate cyclase [Cyanobacteria bacterium HKST-UBA02]